MRMNMRGWVNDMISAKRKKALPVLSFPCVSLMGVSVRELISDSKLQAEGMRRVAERCDAAAAVSFMDLSVEAEAFGAEMRASEIEVPTIIGELVHNPDEISALNVPEVGAGRTGLYVSAIGEASRAIKDRPVFAGCIGPFSLSGRLRGMADFMVDCFEEPDSAHELLEKSTEFIVKYITAFREAGANGVVLAEPAAGLLSPNTMNEFSCKYVAEIISAVQTDEFAVIYHNCGNSVNDAGKYVSKIGAMGFHFGNAADLEKLVPQMPQDAIVMGNVDPARTLRNGTPEKIEAETREIMAKCTRFANYVPSTGCDVPPATSWENIDAFFRAVAGFYAG